MSRQLLLSLLGAVGIMGVLFWSELFLIGEHVALSVFPSAERAYQFGSRHIDAHHPALYDLRSADYFFHEAERIDARYPWLQHQLARIAFLRGNFQEALIRINAEIEIHGQPSSYYVRGLIYGFMGEYEKAAADYRTYLESDPTNWAATNDLAWVLLKDKRYDEALVAIDAVISKWPDNPWLHNSRATALVELGRVSEARDAVQRAALGVENITDDAWQTAYPGNDPLIAQDGVRALRNAIHENMHMIGVTHEESDKHVQ